MIKKRLGDDRHTLITTEHYPYHLQVSGGKKTAGSHKALIGVGGNIGDTPRRFEHLYWLLKRSRMVTLVETAPIYRNPPFGYLDQADFYNTLILLQTSLTPRQLLHYLLRVERHFGRKRKIKDGPRTLDLDIIFYDDIGIDTERLKIPHPEWMHRNSVLIPLKYMKGRR